jgi:hypothetical protein
MSMGDLMGEALMASLLQLLTRVEQAQVREDHRATVSIWKRKTGHVPNWNVIQNAE